MFINFKNIKIRDNQCNQRHQRSKRELKKPSGEEKPARRSEEIVDIVDRMPMTFGRWVALSVVVFSTLLVIFGWIIKYPDTVTGYIRINSTNAPVKLVANVSGTIRLESFQAQDKIKKGEFVAVIENSAITSDVKRITGLIEQFDPHATISDSIQRMFPEKVSLGDLNMKYYTFLSALKNQHDYTSDNVYEKQRISLLDNIKGRQTLLVESEQALQITREKLDISQKWLDKYASLNRDEIITYEYELDRSRNDLLSAKQEEKNLQKEISGINMQIVETRNQISRLYVEQKEKELTLQMDLLASYHDLCDNIKVWEQKFVFKAPFAGRVEYLKFLAENQFVQAGEEIFGIVPEETNIIGQVLLPSAGAGKVKTGSKVKVKLDNYPYIEYGTIDGVVSSISLLTQPQKTAQNSVETYLIVVELPQGLTTNYGETLDFRFEIGGSADIIVKERRLIERLFDNLKYRTK